MSADSSDRAAAAAHLHQVSAGQRADSALLWPEQEMTEVLQQIDSAVTSSFCYVYI